MVGTLQWLSNALVHPRIVKEPASQPVPPPPLGVEHVVVDPHPVRNLGRVVHEDVHQDLEGCDYQAEEEVAPQVALPDVVHRRDLRLLCEEDDGADEEGRQDRGHAGGPAADDLLHRLLDRRALHLLLELQQRRVQVGVGDRLAHSELRHRAPAARDRQEGRPEPGASPGPLHDALREVVYPTEDEYQDQPVDNHDDELDEVSLAEVHEVLSSQGANEEHNPTCGIHGDLQQLLPHRRRERALHGDHDAVEAHDEEDRLLLEEGGVGELPHHHQGQHQQHAHEDEVGPLPPHGHRLDLLPLLGGERDALAVEHLRRLLEEELLLDLSQTWDNLLAT
mmetsp:Transcript_7978/g.22594  ORF Transcript_7978/g.22594 Transcript_7978/m.22594 type:complete len:336 (+) Transcript_7978:465-1472(+)